VFSVRNGVPTVGITVGDVAIDEGDGGDPLYLSIPVFLTEASTSTVTVNYTTANGSALAGQDYVAQSGILTFAAGVTQQNILVAVIGDSVVENSETFTVTLSDPSEGASILDGSGTGTIADDDASLSIAAASADAAEGNADTTVFTFTVTRTGGTDRPATATWTVSGEAVNGADFAGGTLPSDTVTLGIGETSKTIILHVAGDTQIEADEGFTVTLSAPGPGTSLGTASATGFIRNDDVEPASLSIAATSADKAEGSAGSAGSTPFTFTVTRTGDLTGASSAEWAVSGAAVTGIDFTGSVLPTGTVSFAAGEASKVIIIEVVGDSVVETDEAFSVTLSNPSVGTVIGTASASGLIRNDDASLSITATSADKPEGQSGSTAFTFTVTRTGDLSGASSAQWGVNGPAVDGADFAGSVLPTGTVSFAAGETSKVITIEVAGDSTVEPDEAFSVTLSSPSTGTNLGTASATGIIRNDDNSLSIAATSADKPEGDSGGTTFTFTVTRTGDLSSAASAQWAVAGSAVTGADFAGGVLPSGTVSFAAGETSKVITIEVAGDSTVEPDEAFSVTLSSPSTGTNLGTASATGIIRNDDNSLSIAATSADKPEGDSGGTTFTFTVTRTGDLSSAASAQWAVAGSAVTGADFAGGVLPSGTVSFAAGETSKVITIEVAGDSTVEPDEAFSVTLSSPSTGTNLGTASATGIIRNDDNSLSIAATSADKPEGQSGSAAFTFTVTRTGDLSGAASAQWAVAGSAVTGADFAGSVLPTGTVSFAAGETSKVITIEVAGDSTVEPDEAFSVTLSSPSTGTNLGTASATGIIRNDDNSLSIAATSADKPEGQSGSAAFTFTVTRTGDLSGAASAQWAVAGSAVTGADFAGGVLPSGTVSFAAGETSKVITIEVAGDSTVEPDEAFSVTLSSPSTGINLGTASATGIIRNDDNSLSIAATSADKPEGDSGGTTFTFTVTRTGDLSSAASAQWAVAGSAVTGADFAGGVLPSGTVSFAAGETSKVITIEVAGDSTVEPDEAFSVTLSSPSTGINLGTASATGIIRNDDNSLSIAATSADKPEGDSGGTTFTFTVTRTGDLSSAASAQWAVAGSAVTGADFAGGVMPSGTVSFAAGETSKVITIEVAGDSTVEPDEAFSVTLSSPSTGTNLGTASATGIIRNDDNSLSIAATSADKPEGDSGGTTFTFTVTRTGDLSSAASAQWAVAGSAVTGADFAGGVLPSGTVSFAAGETSKVITIEVAGDSTVEPDEAFSVTLSSPSTGTNLGTASATGIIRNDDNSLSIAATSADKPEGQSGSAAFTFTVTRTGDLSGAASAQWAVAGSAVTGADFAGSVLPTGTVSFAAGETSKVITIEVAGDSTVEPDEAFSVTLSSPSTGTNLGTASATGIIRNDDNSLSIAATSADKPEGDSGGTTFTFTVTRTGDLSGAASVDWAASGAAVFDADFIPFDSLLESSALISLTASEIGAFFPQIPTDADAFLPAFSLFGGAMPGGTLNFAAGESSKIIHVWALGEILAERDESFVITLSNASEGVSLDTASAVGTIRDDDGAGTIRSSVSLTLSPEFTKLILTDAANIDGIGNALDNQLFGNVGNNVLDGRAGADRMAGGLGNDTYIVDDAGDVVFEAADEGTDEVQSSVSFSLANGFIDNIILAGSDDIDATGNALDNHITGNAGNNRLYGGDGNDSFRFDTALSPLTNVDTIIDFNVSDDTILLANAIFTALTVTGTLAEAAFHIGPAAASTDHRIIYDNVSGDLFYDPNGDAAGGSILFAHLLPGLALTFQDFLVI
jgi:hypothetical protein